MFLSQFVCYFENFGTLRVLLNVLFFSFISVEIAVRMSVILTKNFDNLNKNKANSLLNKTNKIVLSRVILLCYRVFDSPNFENITFLFEVK